MRLLEYRRPLCGASAMSNKQLMPICLIADHHVCGTKFFLIGNCGASLELIMLVAVGRSRFQGANTLGIVDANVVNTFRRLGASQMAVMSFAIHEYGDLLQLSRTELLIGFDASAAFVGGTRYYSAVRLVETVESLWNVLLWGEITGLVTDERQKFSSGLRLVSCGDDQAAVTSAKSLACGAGYHTALF